MRRLVTVVAAACLLLGGCTAVSGTDKGLLERWAEKQAGWADVGPAQVWLDKGAGAPDYVTVTLTAREPVTTDRLAELARDLQGVSSGIALQAVVATGPDEVAVTNREALNRPLLDVARRHLDDPRVTSLHAALQPDTKTDLGVRLDVARDDAVDVAGTLVDDGVAQTWLAVDDRTRLVYEAGQLEPALKEFTTLLPLSEALTVTGREIDLAVAPTLADVADVAEVVGLARELAGSTKLALLVSAPSFVMDPTQLDRAGIERLVKLATSPGVMSASFRQASTDVADDTIHVDSMKTLRDLVPTVAASGRSTAIAAGEECTYVGVGDDLVANQRWLAACVPNQLWAAPLVEATARSGQPGLTIKPVDGAADAAVVAALRSHPWEGAMPLRIDRGAYRIAFTSTAAGKAEAVAAENGYGSGNADPTYQPMVDEFVAAWDATAS